MLLRLARELRRETEQLGITSRQGTLLWLIRLNPGLSLRELAAEERISAPALSGHVDRLEKAGLIARVRDERRPPPRRPDADRGGRAAAPAPPRPPDDLARGAPARARRRRGRRDRGCDRAAGEAPVTAALLALNARTFASLRRHRNYRLFFTGQVISVSGTWMQNVALAWLVVELTHSPLAVGLLAFCRFIPFTVFGLFAGVVADRIDNRKLVIGTQADLDDLRDDPGGARADRLGDALARLPARRPLEHGARLRRARPARAHLPDGRPRRAAERGRAEREPLQRLAGRRPGDRRRAHRSVRRGRLLRDQRGHASSPSSRRCC